MRHSLALGLYLGGHTGNGSCCNFFQLAGSAQAITLGDNCSRVLAWQCPRRHCLLMAGNLPILS